MDSDKDTLNILRQCVDMLEDELEEGPLLIERPSKEDFVLVSDATYSSLMQRIYDLEHALQTDEEREAEEEYLLREMVEADNNGGMKH